VKGFSLGGNYGKRGLIFCCLFFFFWGGDDCNDPDLVQAFLKKWWVESDFKAPNLPFHYGSKFTAVIKTVFITILEQNR
jgi:hypothetical protein